MINDEATTGAMPAIYGETPDEARLEDACDRLGLDPADRRHVLAGFRSDPSLLPAALDLAILKHPVPPGVAPDAARYGELGLEEYARMVLFIRDRVARDRAERAPATSTVDASMAR